jgi:nickel transport protein
MMKHSASVLIALFHVFLAAGLLYAHGVQGSVEKGGLAVTARYDTGEVMSYAKVRVSAPSARLPFQTGRTDRNGRFCFRPDAAGIWKVVVDDETGHRLEVEVPVNEDLALSDQQPGRKGDQTGLSRFEKALMGLSIIFGLAGLYSWWGVRKRTALMNRDENHAASSRIGS